MSIVIDYRIHNIHTDIFSKILIGPPTTRRVTTKRPMTTMTTTTTTTSSMVETKELGKKLEILY